MIGYITIRPGAAQRLSEKWRHFACTYVAIIFCTSEWCAGVRQQRWQCEHDIRQHHKATTCSTGKALIAITAMAAMAVTKAMAGDARMVRG